MDENEIRQAFYREMGVPENAVFPENTERQWGAFAEMNGQKYMALVEASAAGDLSAVCVAMINAAKEFTVILCRAFSEAVKEISNFIDAVICIYPNRRIVHLAQYGRSERVRKKNRKRILKWIERGCKV